MHQGYREFAPKQNQCESKFEQIQRAKDPNQKKDLIETFENMGCSYIFNKIKSLRSHRGGKRGRKTRKHRTRRHRR
jgi:hypothetical protein